MKKISIAAFEKNRVCFSLIPARRDSSRRSKAEFVRVEFLMPTDPGGRQHYFFELNKPIAIQPSIIHRGDNIHCLIVSENSQILRKKRIWHPICNFCCRFSSCSEALPVPSEGSPRSLPSSRHCVHKDILLHRSLGITRNSLQTFRFPNPRVSVWLLQKTKSRSR